MKILALELSTARGSIAWLDEDDLVMREWTNDRKNSGPFFVNLQSIREKFGPPEEIIVGLGPGSYAGIRIAISAAIGLQVTSKTRLIGSPTGYIGSEQGGQLTRPVMANPRRLILFDEIEKAYPPVFDLFLQLMGEARLTEQGSGKAVDYSQCIFILTSNAHAEEIGQIQREVTDYHEMINAVKGYLAESKVFRPEILGRIDKVYVFQPLQGMVVAEIALLKISKLAKEYGLGIQFVAPELIMQALVANDKVSRLGIRELERILFDMFAMELIDAKDSGATRVELAVGEDGRVLVRPAS